jgi:hypothetical protein
MKITYCTGLASTIYLPFQSWLLVDTISFPVMMQGLLLLSSWFFKETRSGLKEMRSGLKEMRSGLKEICSIKADSGR